jgi:hypothetical protein
MKNYILRSLIVCISHQILLRWPNQAAKYGQNIRHHSVTREMHEIYFILLFILTANGFLPGGSGNIIRHKKQITHITQNNTTIKRNTAHKTTHTIKDTLHRMNTTIITTII